MVCSGDLLGLLCHANIIGDVIFTFSLSFFFYILY
jgi:hypothetical protein